MTIRSIYEVVRLRDIGDDLEVVATSAGVTAADVSGRVDLTTSYATVELTGVGGPIDVRNQSGRVRIRGLRKAALSGQNRVETSYGDIDFSWPPQSGMRFAAESTYGAIRSDFAATHTERASRQRIGGVYDPSSGAAPVSVTHTARSGNVHLRMK